MGKLGKHASGTLHRHLAWAEVVWPLVLEQKHPVFTLKQYHEKRDEVCRAHDVSVHAVSRGLASLLQKGLIRKDDKLYSIHYKLIPYLRLGAECKYSRAIHEIKVK